MRKLIKFVIVCLFVQLIVITSTAIAYDVGKIGIRGGIGTDISGGIAYGFGVNYKIKNFEIGPLLFISHSEEDESDYGNDYHEETDVTVFGALFNYVSKNSPADRGFFYVAGVGIAAINAEWEESSSTDETLGTRLPGGGSKQSEDVGGVGFVTNFGVGYKFNDRFDARLELPIIFISSAPGDAAPVVPTAMLTAGYRF